MKKKKLKLKKITVSNLEEDFAKLIYGGYGDEIDTYTGNNNCNCTVSCTGDGCVCTTGQTEQSMACPSAANNPNCTSPQQGCTGQICPSRDSPCFTQGGDCSYGHCTDINQGCHGTNGDQTCNNTCVAC